MPQDDSAYLLYADFDTEKCPLSYEWSYERLSLCVGCHVDIIDLLHCDHRRALTIARNSWVNPEELPHRARKLRIS